MRIGFVMMHTRVWFDGRKMGLGFNQIVTMMSTKMTLIMVINIIVTSSETL